MKKVYLLIFLLFLTIISYSQLTVTLPAIAAVPGQTIFVPVKLIGGSITGVPVGSANIQITFDPAVLTYVNLVNYYSGTPASQWYF